jgi:hypothetical protein
MVGSRQELNAVIGPRTGRQATSGTVAPILGSATGIAERRFATSTQT